MKHENRVVPSKTRFDWQIPSTNHIFTNTMKLSHGHCGHFGRGALNLALLTMTISSKRGFLQERVFWQFFDASQNRLAWRAKCSHTPWQSFAPCYPLPTHVRCQIQLEKANGIHPIKSLRNSPVPGQTLMFLDVFGFIRVSFLICAPEKAPAGA